jgi:Fe-S-cluster containining protein
MTPELAAVLARAKDSRAKIKDFFTKLKAKKIKNIDKLFHELHDEVFEEISCLDCAGCCSSISPIVTDNDIARMAKHLRQKPSQIVNQHLYLDHENDYVFKITPCPFLMGDNCCSIYESRPRACREYPHTDRVNMQQILALTYKNVFVCPAVALIVERLQQKVG